ncbi:MAG: cytochrome c maturation protein CcmE [Dongiaceae bacterium]
MKPKHRRLLWGSMIGLVLAIAAAMALYAMQEHMLFFRTPSQLSEYPIPQDKSFRIGGLVKEGSVEKSGTQVNFVVTDLSGELKVRYDGLLPDLFREGQGVVALGKLNGEGVFIASQILAKHDENYMPPEVAESLKKSGRWKGQE